jgi:hypothetical protein
MGSSSCQDLICPVFLNDTKKRENPPSPGAMHLLKQQCRSLRGRNQLASGVTSIPLASLLGDRYERRASKLLLSVEGGIHERKTLSEAFWLAPPAPSGRHMFAETRKGRGRRFVARAVSGEMHRAVAKASSGAIRRYAGEGMGEPSLLTQRGISGEGAPAFPRSPPGSPSRVF